MEGEEEVRVRLPRGNEVLGRVEALLGSSKLRVFCQDNKIRLGRIPGKLRKRMWVREGDIVLLKPWDIQGDKSGNIILNYSPTAASWLKRRGILKI
ncbi:MAG: translation initiation factor eIF-1A [Candidatus Aenigmatarchaeota archaeon]